MDKINEIFNFDNVGGKIKSLAKTIFTIELFGSIITAFVLPIASADPDDFILISFLIAIGGPIVACVSSWILYAFGELVEDVHAIRCKYYPIEEENSKRETEEKAKHDAEEKAKQEAERNAKSFYCPNCNSVVHYGDTTCKSCGQQFTWPDVN